jgi:hypothetical protein
MEESEAQIAKLRAAAETAALVRDSLERALAAEECARRRAEVEAAVDQASRAQAETEAAALRQAEQVRRQLGRVARLREAWRASAPEVR